MDWRRMTVALLMTLMITTSACSPQTAVTPTAVLAITAVPSDTALAPTSATPSATVTLSPTVVPSKTPLPPATATASAPPHTATGSPTSPPTPAAPPITLKIVSDLPLSGLPLAETQGVVNAEQLRLEQTQGLVCGGRYQIDFESWDDTALLTGMWDPAVETENANKAATDKTIVAYLGPFNSGAAKFSIPILDRAGPLVMISPASSYPGLTKPGQGVAGEPDRYYPAGVRNFTRVVVGDDVQGTAAARFVHDQLGAKTVYVLATTELFGQQTAGAFAAEAKSLGTTVVGRSSFDPSTTDFTRLMKTVAISSHGVPPDAIYVGMPWPNNAADLLQAKVAAMGDNTTVKVIGPDGLSRGSLIGDAGASVTEGIYATIPGLPPDQLPPAGQKFDADYAAQYGNDVTAQSPYAVGGYEAMSAALQAIENVCAAGGDPTNRRAVRDAVFALQNFSGALGTWSFDVNGDTTLTDMTFYQAIEESFQAVAVSRAGTIERLP